MTHSSMLPVTVAAPEMMAAAPEMTLAEVTTNYIQVVRKRNKSTNGANLKFNL